ncbi:MAG: DUF2007 domain-containing protein [Deltaproteobacteria bacterium]|nr:DUF2007 domain-containing protein [Deltaproteobacteria bacterium]MBW2070687.1 DUF2007 domain-containing protein [Deltaproteobacteria bacterium]
MVAFGSNERDRLVRVHTVENRFEADLLCQALQQDGIPVLLRKFEETAYDGLFVPQMGWGALLVPEETEEAARALIRKVLESTEEESPPENS